MNKTIIELYEQRKGLVADMTALSETAHKEQRKLNEDEATKFEALKQQIADLDAQIQQRKSKQTPTHTPTIMENRSSLSRIIAAKLLGYGKMTAADEAVCQRGYDNHYGFTRDDRAIFIPMESRAALTMGSNGAIGVQQPELMDAILPLENRLVLAKAGARIITGVKGNVEIPVFGAATTLWAGETAAAQDGAGTLSGKRFSPKRITTKVMISKELLLQGENLSIEEIIKDIILSSLANKMEGTLLGSGSSVANTPDGLFGGTIDVKGALSWGGVVGLETAVQDNVNNNCAYIGHSALIGKMKTTVKDASGAGAFIFNGTEGMVNGYKCFGTNNVASALNVAASGTADNNGFGLAFGDWSKFYMITFGAAEITVDPYTMVDEGQIRLVLNAYVDGGLAQAGAIKVGAFK